MELTPPVAYRMSLTAAEVEELLLSIYTKIPTDTIRTSLDSPDDLTIPTTKAVADAIAVINADLDQLGDLALLDSIDLGSTRVTGTLPIGKGGTGAITVEQAQLNLGIVVESAIQQMIDNSIPEIQSVDLGTAQAIGILPLSKGGTGATLASQARTNLGVWSSGQSETLKLDMMAALRRTYAEAGYVLVSGSFEVGGTLTSASDVLLHEESGIAYTGAGPYPQIVLSNTDPVSGGFVARNTTSLRNDLSVSGGSDLVRHGSHTVGDVLDSSIRVVFAPNDGVTEATAQIQAEFDLGGAMFIPEGTYMIRAHTSGGGFAGVFPKNDSLIIFHPKAVFKAITNDKPAYAILNLTSVSDITIIEPNLVGDNDTHTGVGGEFGMGVYMRDAHNIHIINPKIDKCWGDGIYIGQVASVGACTAVTIDNPVIDGCRRQGISVISADGLTINNPVISNIIGTPPAAGIDIEPNNTACILNNIRINNLKTKNTASGLLIDLALYTDGVVTKTVDIVINGHSDEGSTFGATFTRNLHPTAGTIKYNAPTCKNNQNNGIQQRRWSSVGAEIIVDRPVIINPNRANLGAALNAAGIAGYTLSSDASPTAGSGNMKLINPRVIFETGITPAFPAQISFRDTKSNIVDRVEILGMVDNPATFIETTADFNRNTCVITTSSNLKYLGRGGNTEQQNFGIMGKFSGSLIAAGLTSKATINFNSTTQWQHAIIRVAAMCCQATTGTPVANTVGYSESLISCRHKTASVPVSVTKVDSVANTNAVLSVAFFDTPPRAEITVTMQASGNIVGWDIEAGGSAGAPTSISLI